MEGPDGATLGTTIEGGQTEKVPTPISHCWASFSSKTARWELPQVVSSCAVPFSIFQIMADEQ